MTNTRVIALTTNNNKMKKILIILAITAMVASCEKDNEHKNLCPIVPEKEVPSSVINAFQVKYPNGIADKWFNKDNKGYCALLIINGKETKALFDNDGNFQKEEVDQTGDHQDNNDDDGCECEIDDND